MFYPPLYSQRAHVALRTLERFRCHRIVDAGCSRGDLLQFIINAASLQAWQPTDVAAIDIDAGALTEAAAVVPPAWAPTVLYSEDARIRFVQGDLTTPPPDTAVTSSAAASAVLPAAVDAVLSIEVIEHIPPHLVAAYTHTLFVDLGAARGASVVLLTTPNRSENVRLHCDTAAAAADVNSVYRPWEAAPPRRHSEHFFELTRAQWHRYVAYVESCYGAYWYAAEEVLLGDGFTQGTVFLRRGTLTAARRTATSTAASSASPLSRDAGRSHTACAVDGHDDGAVHDACALLRPRDEAVARFPFEAVFGMPRAAYDQHFLVGDGTAHAEDAATAPPEATYRLVESRVIPGKDLWHVLCDIVRRGHEQHTADRKQSGTGAAHQPRRHVGERHGRTAATSLAFPRFYRAFLSPLLPMLLGGCALDHLLRSALEPQRAIWAAAVEDDWAAWTRFLADGRRRHAVVRTSGLRASDATRPSRGTAAPRLPSTARSVPLTVHGSVADAVLSGLAACKSAPAPPGLARFTEEGRHRLLKAAGNAAGLLLHTWVCGEVRRCRDSAVARGASRAAPTMALLPACVRWGLLFLVSVDVLPAAWQAVRDPATPQVALALYRDALRLQDGLEGARHGSAPAAGSRRRRFPAPLDSRARTGAAHSETSEGEAGRAARLCPAWLRHYLAAQL